MNPANSAAEPQSHTYWPGEDLTRFQGIQWRPTGSLAIYALRNGLAAG